MHTAARRPATRANSVKWWMGLTIGLLIIAAVAAVVGCDQGTNPFQMQVQKPDAPQEAGAAQTTFGGPQNEVNARNTDGLPMNGDWVPGDAEAYPGRKELVKAGIEAITLEVGEGRTLTIAKASADNLNIQVNTFDTSVGTDAAQTQGQTSTPTTTGTVTQDTTSSPKVETGLSAVANIPVGPNSQASGSAAAGAGGATVDQQAPSSQQLTAQMVEAMKDPNVMKTLMDAWIAQLQAQPPPAPPADVSTNGAP